jgi:hypothetical protein
MANSNAAPNTVGVGKNGCGRSAISAKHHVSANQVQQHSIDVNTTANTALSLHQLASLMMPSS